MLTLYGHGFSRAIRVIWLLQELGIDYQHVPTGFLDGGSHAPDYLRINPNGRVPAIVDDGHPLFESLAINLYLVRKHGGPLAPIGLWEEALAMQWGLWGVNELERPLLLAWANLSLFAPKARRPDELELALARIDRPMRVLDGKLAGQPHLLGERFTVADLNLAGILALVPMADIPIAQYPHASAWLDRCLGRPAAPDFKEIQFSVPRPPTALGVLGMFI